MSIVVGRVVGSPSRAEAVDNNLDWNIRGGYASGLGNNGNVNPSNQLSGYVGYTPASMAYAVATQEMCTLQYSTLAGWLSERGYKSSRIVTNVNENSNCFEHGNAIFWRGGCVNVGDCDPMGHFGTQGGESDLRGFVCAVAGTGVGTARCSTHLSNNSDRTVAQNQSYEYYVQMYNRAAAGGAVVAMGDFNLNPTQFPSWSPYFVEGDPWNYPTHPTGGKIDRQLYSYPFCVISYNPPSIYDNPFSDHHVYRAWKNPSPC